ncbi:uncharacterized protein [Amphiura filiformis]|uniref:uncharacterized protein n=1 Tax=Amphiura filiformis TaxID=82378 RepID=UPI003B20EC91
MAANTGSGMHCHLYALSSISNKCGSKHKFYGMDGAGDVYECAVNASTGTSRYESPTAVVQQGKFYAIVGKFNIKRSTHTPYIEIIPGKAMIIEVNDTFEVNEQRRQQFDDPPTVTLSDIKNSPKSKLVTVNGQIEKVYNISSGLSPVTGPWKRRDIMIQDNTDPDEPRRKKVCLKLWGETSVLVTGDDEGANITVKNCIIDEFRKQDGSVSKNLASTEIIDITVKQDQDEEVQIQDGDYTYKVIGASEQEGNIVMVTKNFETIQVLRDIFLELNTSLSDFVNYAPLEVVLTYQNNQQTHIRMIRSELQNKQQQVEDQSGSKKQATASGNKTSKPKK